MNNQILKIRNEMKTHRNDEMYVALFFDRLEIKKDNTLYAINK